MPRDFLSLTTQVRVPLGYVLGLAYILVSQPDSFSLAVGVLIALPGLLLRGWASGHLEKNVRLATTGPYACSRNPLYLGTLLLGVGFAIAGGTLLLGAAFLLVMLFIYWPVMRQEEAALISRFGRDYRTYASTVPLFWPRLKASPAATGPFQWTRYRKNREYQAAAGFTGAVLFLCLKLWLR